jgi:uncharacterized ion transporter superfamily protein YfcC
MPKITNLPSPLTILFGVILLASIGTWLIPAGQYNKLSVREKTFVVTSSTREKIVPFNQKTLDSLHLNIAFEKFDSGDIRKPVSIPGTYQKLESKPQNLLKVLQAPIKGIYDSIDIAFFILIMGSFVYVFNETKAIEKGVSYLAKSMKGREPILIVFLVIIFSFCRASYGMEEEALVFYPILVPLFLKAGYDLLVPLSIIFGGTTVGGIAAFSNPFSTIIASNAAGINWLDGIYERLFLFVILTTIMIFYILRYAKKVKNDPTQSFVFKIDGLVKSPYDISPDNDTEINQLSAKTKLLLSIFLFTFLGMIGGVILYNWWTLEMTAIILASTILVGIIMRMNEKIFISQFIKGAESLLSVALIVGVARGVTIILNDGNVSDSILYYTTNLVQGVPAAIFILLLLLFFFLFSLCISSTSGMAVLTMPIIGALAIIVNIPGKEVVNSYVYGMNLMCFISPTSLILPSLAMVNLSFKVWIKFIMPILFLFAVICAIFLIVGVYS